MVDIIQTLWIGDRLSQMERMALTSFVQHGHLVRLYTYAEVANVPEGVTLQDGNEVIPESTLFHSLHFRSYSECSDLFRYKLLLDKGGFWVDTDIICLKPFNFVEPYVFASELTDPVYVDTVGVSHATGCVIKAPKDSPMMAHAYETCLAKDPQQLVWGEIGPQLVAEYVASFGLDPYVQDVAVFCPLANWLWRRLIEPGADVGITEQSCSIHLYNELWSRARIDKEQTFPADCFYERLKKRLLPS